MTWLFVTTNPSGVIAKPDPDAPASARDEARTASMRMTEGPTRSATAATVREYESSACASRSSVGGTLQDEADDAPASLAISIAPGDEAERWSPIA
jgi:hypothetical protein